MKRSRAVQFFVLVGASVLVISCAKRMAEPEAAPPEKAEVKVHPPLQD
jgi:hypothetical protein